MVRQCIEPLKVWRAPAALAEDMTIEATECIWKEMEGIRVRLCSQVNRQRQCCCSTTTSYLQTIGSILCSIHAHAFHYLVIMPFGWLGGDHDTRIERADKATPTGGVSYPRGTSSSVLVVTSSLAPHPPLVHMSTLYM